MIAGTGGDSGKTIFTLGLLSAWRRQDIPLRAFKKGPDFIDAAWLSWAVDAPARNLDSYMMGFDRVMGSFRRHAISDGINVIEGNRGLLDGVDAGGTHSSAALASLLACPVVLVLTPAKVTATAAATVLGCRQLAPDVDIAGVILNQVAGERHASVVRQAIEEHAGVPVLGVIPKLNGRALPSRHLGLVPPAEQNPDAELGDSLAMTVQQNCDMPRLEKIARAAVPFEVTAESTTGADYVPTAGPGLRIGYFSDSAFTFYYPENLEALQVDGAELIPISALNDACLPDIDGLYIGGGFPETHTEALAANSELHAALKAAAAAELPIYAECGGLMYLAERLEWEGRSIPMAGVLPIRVRMHDRPQGHGYCRMQVDRPNPFFREGTELFGHEFHYSHVTAGAQGVRTAYQVVKGKGSVGDRDGFVLGNTLASYLHLHALGCPEWAPGFLQAAAAHRHDREGRRCPGTVTTEEKL
jgi:cobyrinic acid a,c-diamide synthase